MIGKYASFFGIVVNVSEHKRASRGDVHFSFTMVDESSVATGAWLKCVFFAKSKDELPRVCEGAAGLVRSVKVEQFNGKVQTLANFRSSWTTWDTNDQVTSSHGRNSNSNDDQQRAIALRHWYINDQILKQWSGNPKDRAAANAGAVAKPEAMANGGAASLGGAMLNAKAASSADVTLNSGAASSANVNADSQSGDRRNRATCICNMEPSRFYNCFVEVVKAWYDVNQFTMHVTDYTENEMLNNQPANAAGRVPPGKRSLNVIAFDATKEFCNKAIRAGDFIFIRNMRTKLDSFGNMEARIHGDTKYPKKVLVKKLSSDSPDFAPLLK